MSNRLYIQTILNNVKICHELQLPVDSAALASLSTSVKEPQERLIKIDLAEIKESIDEGELQPVN